MTLTPAEAAIWTPPVGQTMGVAIPGTIVNPFTKDNIPDTPESRLTLAWCASQPLSKQGLYAGRIGSAQELATPLTPTEQATLCQQLYAEGVLILLPVDYRQNGVEITMQTAQAWGLETMPAGNPTSVGPAPSGTFLVSTSVMDFPPAAWAMQRLTPPPVPSISVQSESIQAGCPMEHLALFIRTSQRRGTMLQHEAIRDDITENGAQYSFLKEPSAMPGDTEPTLLDADYSGSNPRAVIF